MLGSPPPRRATHLASDGVRWEGPEKSQLCNGSDIPEIAASLSGHRGIAANLSKLHGDIATALQLSGSHPEVPAAYHAFFGMQPTPFEVDSLLYLLEAVTSALFLAGVRFCLFGGSLVGALRHYGRVPWDDDVTLLSLDKRGTTLAMRTVCKRGIRSEHHGTGKLACSFRGENVLVVSFASSPRYLSATPFPEVEIEFMPEASSYRFGNKTRAQIWNKHFARAQTWPLRPFEHLLLPVPHRAEMLLQQQHTGFFSECLSRPWPGTNRLPDYDLNPELKRRFHLPQVGIPCVFLVGVFPMVVSTQALNIEGVRPGVRMDVIGDLVWGFKPVLWNEEPESPESGCWSLIDISYRRRPLSRTMPQSIQWSSWSRIGVAR